VVVSGCTIHVFLGESDGRLKRGNTYAGYERESARCDDGPGREVGDQVLEEGPGAGDLDGVVAVEFGEETLHVFDVCACGYQWFDPVTPRWMASCAGVAAHSSFSQEALPLKK
jgi:hypothetical protein